MKRTKWLLWAGMIMYVVAWFLPVHKDGGTLSKGILPGWEAFRVALSPVWDNSQSDPWTYKSLIWVASGLSNVVILVAAVVLLKRANPPRYLWAVIAICAVLNLEWLFPISQIGDLRVGYYLWAVSFFLVAAGMRRAAQQERAIPPAG